MRRAPWPSVWSGCDLVPAALEDITRNFKSCRKSPNSKLTEADWGRFSKLIDRPEVTSLVTVSRVNVDSSLYDEVCKMSRIQILEILLADVQESLLSRKTLLCNADDVHVSGCKCLRAYCGTYSEALQEASSNQCEAREVPVSLGETVLDWNGGALLAPISLFAQL